jgi:hypothetical protein
MPVDAAPPRAISRRRLGTSSLRLASKRAGILVRFRALLGKDFFTSPLCADMRTSTDIQSQFLDAEADKTGILSAPGNPGDVNLAVALLSDIALRLLQRHRHKPVGGRC